MSENWRVLCWVVVLWVLASVAFLIALCLTIGPASAQQQACPAYAEIKKALAEEYGEAPAGSGILDAGKSVLMIFASPKGESWTAATLNADGTACIVAHGSDWEDVIPPEYSMKGRRPA